MMAGIKTEQRFSAGPFIVLTLIYFIVGFLTTVNGQFQGPLNIAFLSKAEKLVNTLTTMISFFFFLGYPVNSSTAGRWIDRRGYHVTLVRALMVMTSGLLLYSLSSWTVERWPDGTVSFGNDIVPWGYFIFLCGSFLMGSSAAMLQVVINPYVAAYALRGTTPVQRMNIVCGVNSIGTTVAPFFVTGVIFSGVAFESVRPGQLMVPFLIIAGVIAVIATTSSRLNLPDLAATRSREKLPRSIWEFRHLALGVAAIFFYVGTEVAIGVNVNLHAMQMIERGEEMAFFGHHRIMLGNLNLGIPALLATLYWGCIFTLATAGLGCYTSKASGVFMAGVFGGAVFPVVQGMLADVLGGWRWTWTIALVCELFMLWYALYGCKVKDSEALANIHLAPSDPG